MMMGVAAYIALFGGMFALVLAGGQAFVRKPDWKNLVLALFWLCIAVIQSGAGAGELHKDQVRLYNLTVVITGVSWPLIGPLFYLYFYRSIITPQHPRWKDALHFLPGAVCLALFLASVGNLRDPGFERLPMPVIADVIGSVATAGYLLLVFVRVYRLARSAAGVAGTLAKIVRNFVLLILPLVLAASLFWTIHMNAAVTFIIIAVFWMSIRFPRLFHQLRKEAKKARYEKSRLAGLDAHETTQRLRAVMESEKLYAREDIRLRDIAERLGLTEYQLSEFLNARLSVNFHGFLNGYRIAEAKRLLREDRSISALAAGLQVGFNSNSAFYNAFRAETGMSPGQFRKSAE